MTDHLPGPGPAARLVARHCDSLVRHPGLFLERYFTYADEKEWKFNQKDQAAFLEKVARLSETPPAESKEILAGWDELVEALAPRGAIRWEKRTLVRLASHLSRPTPIENGACLLHPVFGFPYLRGESLKGLARAAAFEQKLDEKKWERILGSTAAGGTVAVLDAWPKEWPVLETDVTTSLHREYYESRGGSAPGDWEGANPVTFLTIAAETLFRFAVLPLPAAQKDDAKDVRECLTWGLENLGAGARTASAYGFFISETTRCAP
ncbi:MAG: type III-B CRISPR module RAMP protein Cmr6 [Thermoanaerobaculia bacterium]|nr:type III-B CRISPR module RAMP protein Cmr6 [Thermoanaerobaculia bacterium]